MSRPKNFENKKEYQKWWDLTPKGKARTMWRHLRNRASNKDGKNPTYANIELRMTRQEFVSWVIPELESWCQTLPIQEVSLDRISNDGHYEIGNLQLLTKSDNSRKTRKNKNVVAPVGQAWCSMCKKYLTVDNFYKDRRTMNGLRHICKPHTYRKKNR